MTEAAATGVAAPELFAEVPELAARFGDASLFRGLEPLVYMNHAGISPCSARVQKAVRGLLSDYGKRGAGAYLRWAAQRDRLRQKLAALIGAGSADDIVLTQNTSRGLSDIALSLPWVSGDGILVFEGEFPANVIPWQLSAQTFSLQVHSLPAELGRDPQELVERMEQLLKAQRVRAVAVSAVQFQTGLRMPLSAMSEVAHRYGAWLVVDAVQACGATPIDVRREGIDLLACGSHKWLMGIEGGGFVYASPEAGQQLVARTGSWFGAESPVDFLFEGAGKLRYDKAMRGGVSKLETGNVSASAFVAIEASLDGFLQLGPRQIFEHIQSIHDAIEPRAVELGFSSRRASDENGRSGILSLLPPPGIDVVALGRELARLGVAIAIPDGHLRLSPHFWNAIDESEQVLLSLEETLAVLR